MDLCMQAFDMKDPVAAKPRLRFDGDRNTPSWRARQEGAKYLAAGAFLALRNVAAHEDEVTWTEQEALEHLATLSVLARWIEQCTPRSAPLESWSGSAGMDRKPYTEHCRGTSSTTVNSSMLPS
ncbi:TIGR02391 family protein [Streptomyces sp. NPDC052036]|uniref:TIGR02391 family protein n=1 Tax=Streptomyces sp. NPDC052036 TaxID=3155171 RepID=UPI0034134622